MRVPDIYIIGAQKSGTTTLYDWLAQHPQIYGHPLAKDYPYFSDDCIHDDDARIFYSFSKDAPINLKVLGGDANAMYASLGPRRMKQTMPNARLIAILRHPVQRAYSAYCHAVERLMEVRPLEQAIREELEGIDYNPVDALRRDYLAHGHYARQLRTVFHYFPQEQVKVVLLEELKHEPLRVLDDLFSWLGVVQGFVPDMSIKNETQGGVRYKWLARLAHFRPDNFWVRDIGKVLVPYSLRTSIRRKLVELNRVPAPKPEFHDALRQCLIEYYRDEVSDLERLLSMDLATWKVE